VKGSGEEIPVGPHWGRVIVKRVDTFGLRLDLSGGRGQSAFVVVLELMSTQRGETNEGQNLFRPLRRGACEIDRRGSLNPSKKRSDA
jgi:hypothetical protein